MLSRDIHNTFSSILENFPHYNYIMSSFERVSLAERGWVCWACCNGTELERKEFDESFNHKPCDALGIPRVISRPIDFTI